MYIRDLIMCNMYYLIKQYNFDNFCYIIYNFVNFAAILTYLISAYTLESYQIIRETHGWREISRLPYTLYGR